MELFVHTDRGSSEEIEDVIAHALWEKGYRGNVYSPSTGNSTEIRDLRGASSVIEKDEPLWLVQADETEGEHSRLIEFLVRAPTRERASSLAWDELKTEWVTEPDEDSTDGVLLFFGAEIQIDSISVNATSEKEVLQHFTRVVDDLMGGEERHCPDEDSPDMLVDETPLGIALDDNPI